MKRLRLIAGVLFVVLIILGSAFIFFKARQFMNGNNHDDNGLAAYEKGDYDTAIREFKEALSYDPDNSQQYIHLGMAYTEYGSYDEALGYFNQAEACAQDDTDMILTERGRGLAHMRQGDYGGAISDFAKALAYQDSVDTDIRKDILYYEAEVYEAMSDYEGSASAYTQILKITPDEALALVGRGLAYERLGDYSSAEADLLAAIKLDKKSYAVYMSLYDAYLKQYKMDQARGILSEALMLPGDKCEDYYNRGRIYLELNNTVDALSMFEKAYDAGYSMALSGKAQTLFMEEKYDEASQLYEEFFSKADKEKESSTDFAAIYNNFALCLIKLGKYESAAQVSQAGLELGCREAGASLALNKVFACEKMGDWETAYQTAKTYHDKYPADEELSHEYEFLESRISK